ncbi:MAG: phosphodiester glycosidase family protein [bacterium]
MKRIAIGDTVRLVLGFLPHKEHLKTLVGGLPRIVTDGRNLPATDSLPGLTAKFTETRHPRTGIGFSRYGTILYFVTVDGRQQSSVGMSLKEFAALMIEIGCYQALNLDGGGSTTMVVEDKLVNSPSDSTGERPVANALLVVKDKK